MAKRQPSPERTSKSAETTEVDGADGHSNHVVSELDTIDEARARAHERARERTGSDD